MEPVGLKGGDEEKKRHGSQKCFNELNEVIRGGDLILQDLDTSRGGVREWMGGGG